MSKWADIQRRGGARQRSRPGAGGEPAADGLTPMRYEGYGPGGGAVMVDTLSDDPGRVRTELRHAFARYGGNLGADGSVSYLFNTVGLMTYPPGTDEEALMREALEAGAEDVVPNPDHSVEVLADPLEFETVRAVLTHRGFAPSTAEVTQRAATSLELDGESAERMVRLLTDLEHMTEVRDVYSNVEIPDEVLARL